MRRLTKRQALRRLGLDERADRGEVQRTFRRLAKTHHPDLNSDAQASQRFMELHDAYQLLLLRLPPDGGQPADTCPGCRKNKPLGRLLDGRRGCSACLFGVTRRRRRLPGPVERLAWPLAALGTYGIGWLLVTRSLQTETLLVAIAGVACVWLGIGLLAIPLLRPAVRA